MIFLHDVSLKNCLYSVWKQNESGLLTENSHVLNLQGSKVNSFFLKQGQGLKTSAAHLCTTFPYVPALRIFKRDLLLFPLVKVGNGLLLEKNWPTFLRC